MKFSKAVCQSCGSPILKDNDKGTELTGNTSSMFCRRCYMMGSFTDTKMTAADMSEIVRKKMIDMKFPRFLAALLANRVYTLKRWEVAKVS